MKLIEQVTRAAAVASVDARYGYTFEFSSQPNQHRHEYDIAESAIRHELIPLATIVAEMLAALKAQEELASLRFEGDPETAIAGVRKQRRAAIAKAESASLNAMKEAKAVSDNIGKHLFEDRGFISYYGVIVKETSASWIVKSQSFSIFGGASRAPRDRRVLKTANHIMVDGSADVKLCEAAFNAARRACADEVDAAREALRQAEAKQSAAAREALIAASLNTGKQP